MNKPLHTVASCGIGNEMVVAALHPSPFAFVHNCKCCSNGCEIGSCVDSSTRSVESSTRPSKPATLHTATNLSSEMLERVSVHPQIDAENRSQPVRAWTQANRPPSQLEPTIALPGEANAPSTACEAKGGTQTAAAKNRGCLLEPNDTQACTQNSNVMSGAPLALAPEALAQHLFDVLRRRHQRAPGCRAQPSHGWSAADELELVMQRWRATLFGTALSAVTVGGRSANATSWHQKQLRRFMSVLLPRNVVDALCSPTAAQLEPVREIILELTQPDVRARRAALEARTAQREPAVADGPMSVQRLAAEVNAFLATCDRVKHGKAQPWTEAEDRELLHAFWRSQGDALATVKAALIGARGAPAKKCRLNYLRSHIPADALPSRQKPLQTSRWDALAALCANPITRPSGAQQDDAALAKAARAAVGKERARSTTRIGKVCGARPVDDRCVSCR